MSKSKLRQMQTNRHIVLSRLILDNKEAKFRINAKKNELLFYSTTISPSDCNKFKKRLSSIYR